MPMKLNGDELTILKLLYIDIDGSENAEFFTVGGVAQELGIPARQIDRSVSILVTLGLVEVAMPEQRGYFAGRMIRLTGRGILAYRNATPPSKWMEKPPRPPAEKPASDPDQ
jgi:hypothetical protein